MMDSFYWPIIDLLLFGLTSLSLIKSQGVASPLLSNVIGGVVLWIMIWRGQYEISINFLEELWRHNLINLFAAPINFEEWTVAVVITGITKALASFLWTGLISFFIFKISVFKIGPVLWLYCFLLIMTGWVVGFLVTSLILRFGTKIQTFAWAGPVIISPFSAVYYPLSILPYWAQAVSKFIPSSYVFESIRQTIAGKGVNKEYVLMSFFLNIIYLFLSYMVMKKSFKSALNRGLMQIY